MLSTFIQVMVAMGMLKAGEKNKEPNTVLAGSTVARRDPRTGQVEDVLRAGIHQGAVIRRLGECFCKHCIRQQGRVLALVWCTSHPL